MCFCTAEFHNEGNTILCYFTRANQPDFCIQPTRRNADPDLFSTPSLHPVVPKPTYSNLSHPHHKPSDQPNLPSTLPTSPFLPTHAGYPNTCMELGLFIICVALFPAILQRNSLPLVLTFYLKSKSHNPGILDCVIYYSIANIWLIQGWGSADITFSQYNTL